MYKSELSLHVLEQQLHTQFNLVQNLSTWLESFSRMSSKTKESPIFTPWASQNPFQPLPSLILPRSFSFVRSTIQFTPSWPIRVIFFPALLMPFTRVKRSGSRCTKDLVVAKLLTIIQIKNLLSNRQPIVLASLLLLIEYFVGQFSRIVLFKFLSQK